MAPAAAARGGGAAPRRAAREWTQQEVQQAVAEGRYMYTCQGRVYDVQVEALMHPGGRDVLEAYKGQDISSAFRGEGTVAHLHSKGARALLENYCVGTLKGEKAVEPDLPPADLVDESQPLLPQPLLENYCVGTLKGEKAVEPDLPPADLVDESQPLLPQVVKLDPEVYLQWVDAPSTGHPVMFDNAFVERMTCTQWYVVPGLWLPVAGALLWQAVAKGGVPAASLPLCIAIGVLVWQLIEYSIHRWLFHLKPTGPESIKWHFMLHGHHHKYPMDFDRLVFPPIPAGAVMSLFYGLLQALTPMGYACALLAGGIIGYVVYDTTHYALHSGANDPFVTQKLRTSHMDHHYVNDKVGYGISSLLYDRLFGTISPHLAKLD